MVAAIEGDVAPALQALGTVGDRAPGLTAAAPGRPALTLVFDRGGWSPDLFRRLARRGIACLTWHRKFRGRDWPVADFGATTVPVHGPAADTAATARPAEKPVTLPNGFTVRHIRCPLDNGRQVAFITSDPHQPMAEAAGALFSRWSRENFFKCMRDQFNLDALPTCELEPLDPGTLVVNPAWRTHDKASRGIRRQLARLRGRLADAAAKNRPTAAPESGIAELQRALETARASRGGTPTRCRAGDLDEDRRLDALPSRERLVLDIVRMIAYRAEARMTFSVIRAQGRKPHPRKLLRALMPADADILPDPADGVLRVRILGLANDACDRHLEALLSELNATGTVFPGAALRMACEVGKTPEPAQSASTRIG